MCCLISSMASSSWRFCAGEGTAWLSTPTCFWASSRIRSSSRSMDWRTSSVWASTSAVLALMPSWNWAPSAAGSTTTAPGPARDSQALSCEGQVPGPPPPTWYSRKRSRVIASSSALTQPARMGCGNQRRTESARPVG